MVTLGFDSCVLHSLFYEKFKTRWIMLITAPLIISEMCECIFPRGTNGEKIKEPTLMKCLNNFVHS